MTRRHGWSLLLCVLAGCSTAPIANTLDFFCPGKMYPNTVTPYGGVAIPQGPILPPAPGLTIGVPMPPGPVPAPVPIPGNIPPGGIQLQPPLPPPPPSPFGR
jgi:hypothetical protein